MKETFVDHIKPGDHITDYFALRKADLLEKDGRFRLSMELGDATGRIAAVMWDATKEHAELKRDQIHAFGKDKLIDRCEGSMWATIEPEE